VVWVFFEELFPAFFLSVFDTELSAIFWIIRSEVFGCFEVEARGK
jgi:hypothetical protein